MSKDINRISLFNKETQPCIVIVFEYMFVPQVTLQLGDESS